MLFVFLSPPVVLPMAVCTAELLLLHWTLMEGREQCTSVWEYNIDPWTPPRVPPFQTGFRKSKVHNSTFLSAIRRNFEIFHTNSARRSWSGGGP